jgi:uncharacterized phage protein (TIGR02218 family)
VGRPVFIAFYNVDGGVAVRTDIPAAFQAHLDSGSTTICHCTKLERLDGTVMAFASHDRDLTFDGVTFKAKTGFTPTKTESDLGLSVRNLDIMGALSDDSITELDIAVGKYDHAKITMYVVNFQDVTQRFVSFKGTLGNIKRGEAAFVAEMRGLSEPLAKTGGRVFSKYSSEKLSLPSSHGDVSSVSSRRVFIANTFSPNDDGIFDEGDLEFTTGANAGAKVAVKSTRTTTSGIVVELWTPVPLLISIGDEFTIYQGDDGTAEKYKERYGDLIDWRGFNKLPNQDILTYVNPKKLPK